MTRRDFQLIADAVASASRVGVVNHVALSLADHLARSNPRFDRARFLAACLPEPVTRRRAG